MSALFRFHARICDLRRPKNSERMRDAYIVDGIQHASRESSEEHLSPVRTDDLGCDGHSRIDEVAMKQCRLGNGG